VGVGRGVAVRVGVAKTVGVADGVPVGVGAVVAVWVGVSEGKWAMAVGGKVSDAGELTQLLKTRITSSVTARTTPRHW
jgi:hypothetical protein